MGAGCMKRGCTWRCIKRTGLQYLQLGSSQSWTISRNVSGCTGLFFNILISSDVSAFSVPHRPRDYHSQRSNTFWGLEALKVLKEYQISNFPPWLERQNQNDKELCGRWALTFSEALVFSADTDLKTTLSIPPQHYSYILSNDIHEVVRLIVHYVDLVSGEGQSFNSDWNNLE